MALTLPQIIDYIDLHFRANSKRQISGDKVNFILKEISELLNSVSSGTQADWNALSGLSQILNKPSTFAPSAHTHAQSEITGLIAALAAKANTTHLHVIADVTGLQTAIDGKQPIGSYAAASHTHPQSEITGLVTALSTIDSDISAIELILSTLIVDDLSTGGTTKALSAQQGVVLKSLIAAVELAFNDFVSVDYINDMSSKQDVLANQVNIKSIESKSLLGAGNVELLKNNVFYGFTDFLSVAATLSPPWQGSTISTGTFTQNITNFSVNTLGVGRVAKSTTANSGYRFVTDVNSIRIKGNEKYLVRVNFLVFSTLTFRSGFIDTVTNADCADGAYLELNGSGELSGKTASGSVRTASTILTLSLNTWYTFEVVVNSNATSITYNCYNSTGTLLGSTSITTNIPTAVGRETGCGFIATGSSVTADSLIDVDHQEMKITLTR